MTTSKGTLIDCLAQAGLPGAASVNGQTGVVVLDADDIGETASRVWFTPAEETKLSGIATAATANSSDATLLARANHTGSQAISTVTSLQASLDAKAPLASPVFSGDVGIGMTPVAVTDTAVLQLKGSSTGLGSASIRVRGGLTSKDAIYQIGGANGDVQIGTAVANTTGYLGLYAGGAERGRWDSGGSLYHAQFSTTTPGYGNVTTGLCLFADGRMFLSGADFHHLNVNLTGTLLGLGLSGVTKGSIGINSGAVTFNTTSDYRLKEDVQPLTGGLDRLMQLSPKRVHFVADPNPALVDGFLAHEVQAVVPEAVTGERDGVDAGGAPVYQGLDNSKLVPLLVAAVQELAARVAQLENP